MNPSKGYYSIIQYCPDLMLGEVANVGVLLFCPERGFLKALTNRNNRRIKQIFGSEGLDLTRINTLKKGLEERLSLLGEEIRTVEELQQFISTRANLFHLTTPRPMKVFNPEEDLQSLFQRVFGVPVEKGEAKKKFRDFVGERLLVPELGSKVYQDIKVNVPALDKDMTVPFGYQNGRFNLIIPVQFEAANPEQSVSHACKYTVQGRSLYDNPHPQYGPLQLLIVGKFRANDNETPNRVKRVLDSCQIKNFRNDQLNALTDEIRKTGKDKVSLPVGTNL